jgi:hypothetical protein
VHPALRRALAAATAANSYGPVAVHPALRSAAAGYWTRRGPPTTPDQVVCGPGSKPLLFGLLLAIGADVALPRPSWVSYAAQAAIIGIRAQFVPAAPGEGGICDPAALSAAIAAAAAAGRRTDPVTSPWGIPAEGTGQRLRCQLGPSRSRRLRMVWAVARVGGGVPQGALWGARSLSSGLARRVRSGGRLHLASYLAGLQRRDGTSDSGQGGQ